MINVNDFKTGMTISYEGNLYQVLDFQHVKPGKGAAIVKAKLILELVLLLSKHLMLEAKYQLHTLIKQRCNFYMLTEITIAL